MNYGASAWELGVTKLGSGKTAVTARHAKGVLTKARRKLKGIIGAPRAKDNPNMPGSFFDQGTGIRGALSRLGG